MHFAQNLYPIIRDVCIKCTHSRLPPLACGGHLAAPCRWCCRSQAAEAAEDRAEQFRRDMEARQREIIAAAQQAEEDRAQLAEEMQRERELRLEEAEARAAEAARLHIEALKAA